MTRKALKICITQLIIKQIEKQILIISIYHRWVWLSQKPISRYCPFKEAIGEKGLKVAARACVKSDTGSICILISPFDIWNIFRKAEIKRVS